MEIFKPPHSTANSTGRGIFLAGSIEMGNAELWQDTAIKLLRQKEIELKGKGYTYSGEISVFNPRRDDWDSSWEQHFENPQFFQQVTWELHNIKKAEAVIFYFDPFTKSPITLMELGYIAGGRSSKVAVVCPKGYWRRGNVQIICNLHSFPIMNTLEEAIDYIVKH